MRSMTEKEIREFIENSKWGTLIAIDNNKPYAVELSYASDDKFIYCGSMPGGRMAKSIKSNPTVSFKICYSSEDMSQFKAVIIEGQAKILTDRDEIVRGLGVLYKKLGLPESRIETRADQLTANKEKISFYRIPTTEFGGRIAGY
jgi:nitroimidazol reductase NimA-like FMN-containing flavoprotein (pyridoxamine 5'-phosphate oxidase superfamily)